MLLREPFVGRAPADLEESIAQFVRRRLGQEFLDYAIDPFVAGIYAGDPERISVPAAFPRLHALEQKYGSLIKGQILGARERRKNPEQSKNTARSFSFRGGMQTLTDALARAVGGVTSNARVARVARGDDGLWTVDGTRAGAPFTLRARAVVLATPAAATAALIAAVRPRRRARPRGDRLRAGRDRRDRVPSGRCRAFAGGLRLPGAASGSAGGCSERCSPAACSPVAPPRVRCC